MKKLISVLILICVLALTCNVCTFAYNQTLVETQFEYSISNPAWLKTLVVNENMLDVNGITTRTDLVAVPDYPYSKTPDGFKTEVSYYTNLYTLDDTGRRAGYVYVLDYLNQASTAVDGEISDDEIREWLTHNGIIYPTPYNTETLIMARTLYSMMSNNVYGLTFEPGTTIEAALIQYLSIVVGDDMSAILAINKNIMPQTLDEYVFLVCIVALNVKGYNVNSDTPQEEVYRLTAVETIKLAGIAVDTDSMTLEELKSTYMAAMLGKKYDVNLDIKMLDSALKSNSVPIYILRVMAQKNGLAVKSTATYDEAFEIVAKHTYVFAFEKGEFYADVYNYDAQLAYIRDKIWVSVSSLHTADAAKGETLVMKINGEPVGTEEFKEIPLSRDAEIQAVVITVEYRDNYQNITKTYTINVKQGLVDAPQNEATFTGNSMIGIVAGNTTKYISGLLPLLGFDTGIPGVNTPSADIFGLLMPSVNPDNTDTADRSFFDNVFSNAYSSAIKIGSLISVSPTPGETVDNMGTLAAFAGAPPEGYEYVVNESGYVIDIIKIRDEGSTGDYGFVDVPVTGNTSSDSGIEALKSRIPYIAVPVGLAVLAIVCTIIFRKKD
ncbi:MAG TPA: hypothetical protein GXZ23_04510 [Clostridiales bacterium]|nr:hypothetical protein [Clostridiales bacterium]